MAQVIWTEPALTDLDAIADYIALDNPEAARRLVQRVFKHVEQLERHPKSGSVPAELRGSRYRQIVEPPCRIFYRLTASGSGSSTSCEVRGCFGLANSGSVAGKLGRAGTGESPRAAVAEARQNFHEKKIKKQFAH